VGAACSLDFMPETAAVDCSRVIMAVVAAAACSLAFGLGTLQAVRLPANRHVHRPVRPLRNLAAPPSQLPVTPAAVRLPPTVVVAAVRLPPTVVVAAVRLPPVVVVAAVQLPPTAVVAVRLPPVVVAAARSLRIAADRSWSRTVVPAVAK
jgi:hypothetical protein